MLKITLDMRKKLLPYVDQLIERFEDIALEQEFLDRIADKIAQRSTRRILTLWCVRTVYGS